MIGTIRHVLSALLLLLLIAAVGSANAQQSTLYDALQQEAQLSRFAAAVQQSELQTLLHEHGQFTLFVPVDTALAADYFSDLTPTQLRQWVLYHIGRGRLDITALSQQTTLATALGQPINVAANAGGVALNGEAVVSDEPIAVSNGLIYLIDRPLQTPVVAGAVTPQPPSDGATATNGGATTSAATPAAGATSGLTPAAVGLIAPAGGVVDVSVDPPGVRYSRARLRYDLSVLRLALDQMGGWLDRLSGGADLSCYEYLYTYFYVANLPFHTDVTPADAGLIAEYEQTINGVLDSNEPMALYCLNGGAFSQFNRSLARQGIATATSQSEQLQRATNAPTTTID